MRIIGLLTLAAVLHAAAFAQKPATSSGHKAASSSSKKEDPEARNKRALAANSGEAHTAPDTASAPRSGSSARELAKIEQGSIHQSRATHKAVSPKPKAQAAFVTPRQSKGKPVKFSYRPPAAAKTSSKNPSSVPNRSRPAPR